MANESKHPNGIDVQTNKIINVAPGTNPTDAVNVSQLGSGAAQRTFAFFAGN